MITVPIFKHRGGHGSEQFEAQKLIKKIVPSKSIVVDGGKLALRGIITHLGGTTLDEGHFVADILTDDEELHCDDKTISNDFRLSDSGYIFIYSKSNQVQPAEECTGVAEEIQCESCKEPFIITSILRHIALNKKCKAEVSPEFMSYVKDLVVKHRKSMWAKNNQQNKESKRSKMNEWYKRNKEEVKEKRSKRYERNQEEEKQKRNERYKRNQEGEKEKMSQWYERNQEEKKQKRNERYERNQEEEKQKRNERYANQKTIIHATSDARSRFMKFKEETKDGKIRSLKILIYF